MDLSSLNNSSKENKVSFICVDFQYDFYGKEGKWYKKRSSHSFIQNQLIPFLEKRTMKIAEIISDYRLPRPSEHEAYCIPGEKGYESGLPESVKFNQTWIKSMNSPLWVRENAGNPSKPAGKPYTDAAGFIEWLNSTIGPPAKNHKVYLIGLTLDCCVLATAMLLYHLGYAHNVQFLFEGVDSYEGTKK